MKLFLKVIFIHVLNSIGNRKSIRQYMYTIDESFSNPMQFSLKIKIWLKQIMDINIYSQQLMYLQRWHGFTHLKLIHVKILWNVEPCFNDSIHTCTYGLKLKPNKDTQIVALSYHPNSSTSSTKQDAPNFICTGDSVLVEKKQHIFECFPALFPF